MAKAIINGKEYGLRLDLYAMEKIEEEFGSLKEAFAQMRGGKQVRATRIIFRIMANSYLSYHGKEETVTGDEIKHADMETFGEIARAVNEAVEEGSKSETTNGNEADDEVHDAYLEEIERKK